MTPPNLHLAVLAQITIPTLTLMLMLVLSLLITLMMTIRIINPASLHLTPLKPHPIHQMRLTPILTLLVHQYLMPEHSFLMRHHLRCTAGVRIQLLQLNFSLMARTASQSAREHTSTLFSHTSTTHATQTPALMSLIALRPEEHQPSGTCNFSRIDNATLQLVLSNATVGGTNTAKVRVYATNYNVLRIMSGMGGLAYSN